MLDIQREVPEVLRKRILQVNAMPVAIVIALAWLALVGYTLFGRQDNRDAMLPVLFIAAGVATIGGGIYGFIRVRTALHLATHGVPVEATIVHVGKISTQGWVRVDYEYHYSGKTYRKVKSVVKSTFEDDEGSIVPAIIDPTRPKRWMLASDVLPPSKDSDARERGESQS